jgi:hypothetical protein
MEEQKQLTVDDDDKLKCFCFAVMLDETNFTKLRTRYIYNMQKLQPISNFSTTALTRTSHIKDGTMYLTAQLHRIVKQQ